MEERIPPHSDAAERSVLGAVMLDDTVLLDALEMLREEDFYSEVHKEIFATVKEIHRHGEKVDMLTVNEELKRRKTLEMIGGRSYIATLTA